MPPRTEDIQGTACLNCGGALAGEFCQACGQPARTGRLTVRTMLAGVLEGLSDFDRPLYRTLIGLTIRPGRTIAEYVTGRRRSYANPVKYCLSISALLILLARWRGTIIEAASLDMAADADANAAVEPVADFLANFNEINQVIQPYSHLISLAFVPVLAGLLRLAFGRRGPGLADHMAFGCYVLGHAAFINIAVLALDLHHRSMDLVSVLINVGPALYFTWAAIGFNGRGFWSGMARSLGAYLVFVLLTSLLIVAAVLVKMAAG